ncbi:unnamed protein product [Durusdinium trenchii]|uniref:Uncharacterized protein n=1 Tax=Durusdinium trenchii TaxID=1381693 RepID=A0ABP0QTR9_9DINO
MARHRMLKILPLTLLGILAWCCYSPSNFTTVRLPTPRGRGGVMLAAFPRANPGGAAEKLRIAKYEKEEEAAALVKAEKEEEEDPEGTTEEKIKAGGILFTYAMFFVIPITIFGVVLLGIWTPGTEIDRGVPVLGESESQSTWVFVPRRLL